MTPKRLVLLTLCCGLFVFAGCSSVAVRTIPYPEVQRFPPTMPDLVGVMTQAPQRPHDQLGEVVVEPEGHPSIDKIYAALQEGAAPLGADAVVIVSDKSGQIGGIIPASGRWLKRELTPTPHEAVVGVAIRYLK